MAKALVNICQMCGKEEIVPYEKHGQKKSKYCSRSCRSKHYRKRLMEAKQPE